MKILLISTRFPLPPTRGQQVRSLEWLEALKEQELRLLCPEAPEADPTELIARIGPGLRIRCWADSLLRRFAATPRGLFRGWPLQESIFSTAMARAILRTMLCEEDPDLLIIQMVRCSWALETCREVAPEIPIIFDAIDAMGLHYSRRAERGAFGSIFSRIEARRCILREQGLASGADAVTAVSGRDLDFLQAPPEKSRVIPVAGRPTLLGDQPRDRKKLLLSGNLGYRPTIEGALYFARTIWPRLKEKFPDLTWDLAGARPPGSIRRLAKIEGIEVHANPESLAPFLARAGIAIAPMASGSGVPMKVLEAWAAGIPVIAHPWTLAGVEGKNKAALEAQTPEEWIEAIGCLLEDETERKRLVEEARSIWLKIYHPDAVAEAIRGMVRDTVVGAGAGSSRPEPEQG